MTNRRSVANVLQFCSANINITITDIIGGILLRFAYVLYLE
jgi:hypothetical protein